MRKKIAEVHALQERSHEVREKENRKIKNV
jgi:hypothetical protein